MKTVVYKEVPQSPQRVALVQGGSADVAQYLRPRELKALEKVNGIRVDAVRGTQQTWIELNSKMKPFNNMVPPAAQVHLLNAQRELITALMLIYENRVAPAPAATRGRRARARRRTTTRDRKIPIE